MSVRLNIDTVPVAGVSTGHDASGDIKLLKELDTPDGSLSGYPACLGATGLLKCACLGMLTSVNRVELAYAKLACNSVGTIGGHGD